MRTRILVMSGVVALAMIAALWMPILLAQAPSGTRSFDPTTTDTNAAIKAATEATKAAAALKNWTPPRTPWGDPDLRGYWLLATYTPLERPAALENKPFYTEEEAIAAFRNAVEADAGVDPRTVHYDWKEYGMDAWQAGAKPNLRTSLIVDPPDGRIPPLTPEAQQRRAAARAAAQARNPAAGVHTLGNLYTRCILGLGAAPLVRGGNPGSDSAAQAAGVSAESHFVQSPGYMVIVTQSNSDVRIIPLDGRPHLPNGVRQWLGDSRGHWEANTLVVETTNFNDRSPATNFQGSTDALHLVERFTRIGPNTMRYEYTVSDPKTWTKPWSVEAPLPRIDPPIYEFACHEQNYGLINVVRGTQIREAEAASRDLSRGALADRRNER
jgi:hypothetical protein